MSIFAFEYRNLQNFQDIVYRHQQQRNIQSSILVVTAMLTTICLHLDHIANNELLQLILLCIYALHCQLSMLWHETMKNIQDNITHIHKHVQPLFEANEKLHIQIFDTKPLDLNQLDEFGHKLHLKLYFHL